MMHDVGVSRHVECISLLCMGRELKKHIKKGFITVTDRFCQICMT